MAKGIHRASELAAKAIDSSPVSSATVLFTASPFSSAAVRITASPVSSAAVSAAASAVSAHRWYYEG